MEETVITTNRSNSHYKELFVDLSNSTEIEIRIKIINAIYAFFYDDYFNHNYETINWFTIEVLKYRKLFKFDYYLSYEDFKKERKLYYIEFLTEVLLSDMNHSELICVTNRFKKHITFYLTNKKRA